MGRSSQLHLADALAVCQLVHECSELWADADAWPTHLLRGACRLTGASVCVDAEAKLSPDRASIDTFDELNTGWRDAEPQSHRTPMFEEHLDRAAYFPRVVSLAAAAIGAPNATLLRPEMCGDDEWYRSQMYNDYHRPACINGFVLSFVLNQQPGNVLMVQVGQDQTDPAPTQCAKVILALLNRRIAPLVGTTLCTRHQRGMHGLSPRLRQTLTALLGGESEKEIAQRMGLHAATVHEYVGTLYRHFQVRSRSELMAYFLRRRPENPPACA